MQDCWTELVFVVAVMGPIGFGFKTGHAVTLPSYSS